MKRIRLPRYLSLNTIAIYIALFCVATYALLEHTSITLASFSSLKMPLVFLGVVCLIPQIKLLSRVLLRKKYFYVLLALAILCMLLLGTMLLNRNAEMGGSPVRRTVRLVLYLVELFLIAIVMSETNRVKSTISFLFWYGLLIAGINDAVMFSRVIVFNPGKYETYLLGTKFSVAYLHMYLLVLWFVKNRKNGWDSGLPRVPTILLTVLVFLVAIRVNCMTGIIGGCVLIVLLRIIDTPKRKRLLKFTAPWMLGIAFICSILIAFVIDSIAEIPAIEYLIEDVLSRDTSITGRTNIYDMYISNMAGHWLAGFGYGNANEVSNALFGYANTQNALLQWVLQVGVPTTVAMIVLFMQVFRQIKRKNLEMILPLVALIYVFIILGVIETTFNMAFFLWFALIFMLSNEKQQPMQKSQAGLQTAEVR